MYYVKLLNYFDFIFRRDETAFDQNQKNIKRVFKTMERPLPLIKSEGRNLVLVEETLNFIRAQNDPRPLSAVSIIGAYRTGKSFLLSQLMNEGVQVILMSFT